MKAHRVTRARSRDRVLAVEAGQVICPRQGLVEIEQCWNCAAYDGLSSGHIEGVVCRWRSSESFLLRSANV